MTIIACKTVKLSNFQVNLNNMDNFFRPQNDKVVFVVGATGTGKSRLAVDLAVDLAPRFPAEIINSDKIQLYKGLDIATNKISEDETRGVQHHLMGIIPDPDSPFSADDFSLCAADSVESVLSRRRLPIVAGGSNSHIDALAMFLHHHHPHRHHQFCFLWVDVEFEVLRGFVSERVDRMVAAGLVEEVREIFDPAADYSRGLRRAIGVPEFDGLFRAERRGADAATRSRLLAAAVVSIKENTCSLASRQLEKIRKLRTNWGTSRSGENFRRIDATEAFKKRRQSPHAADEAWDRLVAGPGMSFVKDFLYGDKLVSTPPSVMSPATALPIAAAAVAR